MMPGISPSSAPLRSAPSVERNRDGDTRYAHRRARQSLLGLGVENVADPPELGADARVQLQVAHAQADAFCSLAIREPRLSLRVSGCRNDQASQD
jgi:hypothetical protein